MDSGVPHVHIALQGVASKLLRYRELLPGVDISSLAARWPRLLTGMTPQLLQERLVYMRCVAWPDLA